MKAENSLVGETFSAIKNFVKSGRISSCDLDQKVYRVLKVKYDNGLFTPQTREDPEKVIKDPGIIALSKHVARRSVLIHAKKDLPLDKKGKVLVIEQINKVPNDFYWHPGSFYKKCLEHYSDIDYLETAYTYDDSDKERILQNIGKYDKVIITNFYIRGKLSNNEFIEELLAKNTGLVKIVVVTNTPYPISIPKNCPNLVITFATSPDNLEVCAGALFGDTVPEGIWPVDWKN